jgi:hypothetical protein
MSGSATFATERFRLATPATSMSEMRTTPARWGAVALVTSLPEGEGLPEASLTTTSLYGCACSRSETTLARAWASGIVLSG